MLGRRADAGGCLARLVALHLCDSEAQHAADLIAVGPIAVGLVQRACSASCPTPASSAAPGASAAIHDPRLIIDATDAPRAEIATLSCQMFNIRRAVGLCF